MSFGPDAPPLLPFATMRRSGSHFSMNRVLASVILSDDKTFGAHVNSFGWNKLKQAANRGVRDWSSILSYRPNYYYMGGRLITSSGTKKSLQADALCAWLQGRPDCKKLNPEGLKLAFVAMNLEDVSCDEVLRRLMVVMRGTVLWKDADLTAPLGVTLRALRSIALSRKRWLEKHAHIKGKKYGFSELNLGVWKDQYLAAENGRTVNGHPVYALHYGAGVKNEGRMFLPVFSAAMKSVGLRVQADVPVWVQGSVLADGGGSSFLGSGAKKGPQILSSLKDRAGRLAEFDQLFVLCPSAKAHAKVHGEL